MGLVLLFFGPAAVILGVRADEAQDKAEEVLAVYEKTLNTDANTATQTGQTIMP